jgi:hypothetical protein
VKNASAKLNHLLERVCDKEAKKQIERVYDAVYSSPVKSHPDLTEIENSILASIGRLENIIAAGRETSQPSYTGSIHILENGNVSATRNRGSIIDLAGSLESLVNERNRRLKMYN